MADDERIEHVFTIPVSPSNWLELQGRFPLSPAEWDQLNAVLVAVERALVDHALPGDE